MCGSQHNYKAYKETESLAQSKEQNKPPKNDSKETEVYELTEKSQDNVTKMLKELKKMIHEQNENVNKETENTKKNQAKILELQNTM